ncbi:MAG: GGDEF domain-containing protein [Planctomycetota bacterium]|jgi:diguanylate cyclase (GGDEF)-like protein
MNQSGKILLAGDVNTALADIGDIPRAECEIRTNFLDAIDAATHGGFAAIGVAMPTTPGKLGSILKSLRQSCKARIVLLARMPQEPKAIELIGSGLADDYIICPVIFADICSCVSDRAGEPSSRKESADGLKAPPGLDPTTQSRIRQLERLATEDDLTGLKTRKYVWEFARQVINRASKVGGQVTLLVFDIDHLKHYNDLYGHLAGDAILRQAAVMVRRCCRTHDVVGRIGGDEFAVIFWDDPKRQNTPDGDERRSAQADHPSEAISIAKRFVRELEKAELNLLGPDGKGVLAISGGLASYPRDGSTIGELFEKADRALLDAKRSGKSRIYLVGKSPSDIAEIE